MSGQFIIDPSILSGYAGYIWLVISIIFLLCEVGTPGLFFFLSFAIGAAGASLCAFLNLSFQIQCWVALITGIISFSCFKYYLIYKKGQALKTNIDALIEQEGIVTETIALNKTGRVKIRGESWPAIVKSPVSFSVGTIVKVAGLEGNKLIVK
jgi:membrane protein implicated in regulation of membrane protease activity